MRVLAVLVLHEGGERLAAREAEAKYKAESSDEEEVVKKKKKGKRGEIRGRVIERSDDKLNLV